MLSERPKMEDFAKEHGPHVEAAVEYVGALNGYVDELEAEIKRLREGLGGIKKRCGAIITLEPCYPLAQGVWDMAVAALIEETAESSRT